VLAAIIIHPWGNSKIVTIPPVQKVVGAIRRPGDFNYFMAKTPYLKKQYTCI
jgi:hypothetical protein